MTMDKSLKSKNKLLRRRNVLSREERVKRLLQEEQWSEGDSVFGLPKVKPVTIGPRRASRKVEKPEESETPPEAPAAEEGGQ